MGGGEVGVKYYGDSYKGFSIEIPIRVMTNILTSFRLVSLFHKLIGLIYVTGLHNFSSGMRMKRVLLRNGGFCNG